ncbi:MAG: enoyl-CoA hydratase/isomerase family protein [Gallionellaceae bacterium]|nr:enoyl-CoA hydratase/isomerase family protein [Gallionellaceae bacterium]
MTDFLPATESTPLVQINSGIATITLNRPSQRNSLHDEDLHSLLATFEQLNSNLAVRVVILKANTTNQTKPVFCAGYHVSGFDNDKHDPRLFEKLADSLELLRPITLCALNGSVYGGATDLMLACDLRLGLQGTEFRMPACALGLHYYPNGMRRYVSRLGLNLAKRAFLTAQTLKMEQLADRDLFEELVTASNFDIAVQSLANKLAQLAPIAAKLTKQSLNEIAAGKFDELALRERENLTKLSSDFAEGRTAFAERRPPQFQGN